MTIDRAVLALAGTVVLLSVLMAALVSTWWLVLTAFVGVNLLQSSITGFCPAAWVFARVGLDAGCAFAPTNPAPAVSETVERVSPAS